MGKKISVAKKQVRSIEALDVKTDVENQTLEFSFSSEVPYLRWYGYEIISHKAGDMDLTRLNSGAPLLFNHDWDQQVGVVEKAWIGSDKRGYVQVKFSKSEFAQEKFQDIQDGILKGVSFGYIVDDLVLTKESKDAPSEYTAKTTPFEITVCTVPADITVGIGRAAEDGEEAIVIEDEVEDEETVEEENQPAPTPSPEEGEEEKAKTLAAQAAQKERKRMDTLEAVKAERERSAAIRALCEKHGMKEMTESFINNGIELSEVRNAVLEKLGAKQVPVTGNEAVVGLTEKDLAKYSIVRAINALANPRDGKAQEIAKFEREVSDAAAQKAGKQSRGIMIPVDVMRHSRRDLLVGTNSAGGYGVATELQSMIELLRNKSVVQRAGATVMNGLVGNIAFPRQSAAGTAYWVSENTAPTESQQTLDQVLMGPKTIGAFTDFSRKLLLQNSIDTESFVRNDLAEILALGVDLAALYGSGSSGQPTGLKNISGVNTVDLTSYAAPTYSEVVSMETKVSLANADVGTMKYLLNAQGRGNCKVAPRVAGYPSFLLENDMMNGYGTEVSNQIAAGDMFFGVWSQLLIGYWSGIDLLVDPFTGSAAGTVRVVAHQDVDIAARHAAAFTYAAELP